MSQNSNVYVGNLSWNVTEDELKAHFESIGPVAKARIILDKETQRSRGFGFVEFQTDADAQKALTLDGTDFDGRTLRVNLANRQHSSNGARRVNGPRQPSGPRQPGGNRPGRSGRPPHFED